MKVLVPVPQKAFTSLVPVGMNISSHPDWNASTSYVAGARVNRLQAEYEALAASSGVDPAVAAEAPVWFKLGAINSLKAFDETIYDQAVGTGTAPSMDWRIKAATTITAVAFFNLQARSVGVTILADDGTEVLSQEIGLVSDEGIEDWSSYFFEVPTTKTEALFDGLSAYPGMTVIARVFGPSSSPPRVGQVVVGKSFTIGTLCEGTSISIQDYSRKERDEWGNPVIVERPFSQRAEYDVAVPTKTVREVQRILSSVRARPAVYYDGALMAELGTTVYGYFQDFGVSLTVGDISRMNLEVEGLV